MENTLQNQKRCFDKADDSKIPHLILPNRTKIFRVEKKIPKKIA
jgi:hypothetical protein